MRRVQRPYELWVLRDTSLEDAHASRRPPPSRRSYTTNAPTSWLNEAHRLRMAMKRVIVTLSIGKSNDKTQVAHRSGSQTRSYFSDKGRARPEDKYPIATMFDARHKACYHPFANLCMRSD